MSFDTLDEGDATMTPLLVEAGRASCEWPVAKRREMLADLEAHLRELPIAELANATDDAAGYVAELLEAWGLPTAPATTPVPRRLRSWVPRSNPVRMAIGLVLVLAIVGAAVLWPRDRSGRRDAGHAVVPMLYGLARDTAIADLAASGLTSKVVLEGSGRPPGTVLSQQPAEGSRVEHGSSVTFQVAAPIGGVLLDTLPASAVPASIVEFRRTPTRIVTVLASYTPASDRLQGAPALVMVPGAANPASMSGTGSGLCVSDFIIPLNRDGIGVGGGGGGTCTDPRQLPRITYGYAAGYAFGVTSLPANSIDLATSTGATTTATIVIPDQFPGLRIFLTPMTPNEITTLTARDEKGQALATVTVH